MKIFLDTADVDLIGQYYGTGLIDGVTTNPTLIKKSGQDPEEVYRQIALLGVDDISMEIVTDDSYEFLKEGRRLKEKFGEITTIKVPCTPEGLKACKLLSKYHRFMWLSIFVIRYEQRFIRYTFFRVCIEST